MALTCLVEELSKASKKRNSEHRVSITTDRSVSEHPNLDRYHWGSDRPSLEIVVGMYESRSGIASHAANFLHFEANLISALIILGSGIGFLLSGRSANPMRRFRSAGPHHHFVERSRGLLHRWLGRLKLPTSFILVADRAARFVRRLS